MPLLGGGKTAGMASILLWERKGSPWRSDSSILQTESTSINGKLSAKEFFYGRIHLQKRCSFIDLWFRPIPCIHLSKFSWVVCRYKLMDWHRFIDGHGLKWLEVERMNRWRCCWGNDVKSLSSSWGIDQFFCQEVLIFAIYVPFLFSASCPHEWTPSVAKVPGKSIWLPSSYAKKKLQRASRSTSLKLRNCLQKQKTCQAVAAVSPATL